MSLLSNLLLQKRNSEEVVAQSRDHSGSGNHVTTWIEFREDVARLAKKIDAGPGGGWILVTEDAYAFAVGLFALWHTGRHAISPPNHQPESLRALQTQASGIITDHSEWFTFGSCLDPLSQSGDADADLLKPLDRSAIALQLFTSGTTGDAKSITKKIHHLEDELLELDRAWNEKLQGATIFATSSHQHLYGLMIALLWPLCSGWPFERRHYLHIGELVPRMCESANCVLVSVPTQLKRFIRHSQASRLKGICRVIFSSGGPLSADTAHGVATLLGHAPIEIFGSTETGVIGYRVREIGRSECFWKTLPSVKIRREPDSGALRILSPFVSVSSSEEGFSTGDRVEIRDDGSFLLLPRLDRVVKIGEKRLDLARMESDLLGLDLVDEIALTTIERDSELRVAAILVPSEKGRKLIKDAGQRSLGRALRNHLAEAWDPVLHPRLWRMVDQLPENSQGKLLRGEIARLFEVAPPAIAAMDRPQVLAQFRDSEFIERSCIVPNDLACFAGHFPGSPIVPAVLQLDWALDMAEELLGFPPILAEVPSLKLLAPMLPRTRFQIRIRRLRKHSLDLRMFNEEHIFALGRLRIQPREYGSSN